MVDRCIKLTTPLGSMYCILNMCFIFRRTSIMHIVAKGRAVLGYTNRLFMRDFQISLDEVGPSFKCQYFLDKYIICERVNVEEIYRGMQEKMLDDSDKDLIASFPIARDEA